MPSRNVKAKTGTLTGAIGLSGLTKAKDGRWKVFSFIENGSTAAPGAIKDALDGLGLEWARTNHVVRARGQWRRPAQNRLLYPCQPVAIFVRPPKEPLPSPVMSSTPTIT